MRGVCSDQVTRHSDVLSGDGVACPVAPAMAVELAVRGRTGRCRLAGLPSTSAIHRRRNRVRRTRLSQAGIDRAARRVRFARSPPDQGKHHLIGELIALQHGLVPQACHIPPKLSAGTVSRGLDLSRVKDSRRGQSRSLMSALVTSNQVSRPLAVNPGRCRSTAQASRRASWLVLGRGDPSRTELYGRATRGVGALVTNTCSA